MSEIKKNPYEISIWDDVLTYNITYKDGDKETVNVTKLPNTSNRGYDIKYQFFDEQKVAVIGSDIMEAPTRAHNPIFTRKVNGAVELTFTVYNHVYDSESGKYIDNPFAKLLTNERKIKLRYDEPNVDDPWHDLIIKNIQESSDNKTYTYTATSLIVNELSKNGYDLEFDNELMNNQGTVVELAEKIVDGSDWVVGNSDSLQQRIEEPLYAATLAEEVYAYNLAKLGSKKISIAANTKVYIFYSYVAEKKTENVQFILQSDVPANVSTQVLDISDVYLIESVDWSKTFKDITFYPDHRAKRFEYRQKTKYDDVTGRIVSVYKKGGVEYYGYKETKYISPTYVRNLIANGKDFSSTAGWDYFGDSIGEANIDVTYNPPISDENWTAATPYLDLRFTKKVSITNEGIYSNRSYLNTLVPGQKFVLRLKTLKTIPTYVKFFIKSYNGETTFVTFSADSTLSKDGFTYYTGTYSDDGVSEADFASEIPTLFIGLDSKATATVANIMIEEIELFEYIEIDNKLIYPGQITGQELIIQDNYYFYKAGAYDSVEKIKYAYKGLTRPSDFKPVFNATLADENSSGNFEKVRSIVGKESNRYNLIQNLCETFECWADFKVEHNPETGKILLDRSKGFPRQKKTIYFREAVGHHNYAGFRYGVNLKSIQRTLDSNQLASKVIVSNNSNELARDGFCSIARASENPTLENFILCFDYYTQHLLLDNGTITSDLYDGTLTSQKYIGYFPNLLSLNKQRDALIEENAAITAERSSIEAEVQTLALLEQENNQLALEYDAMLANNSGYTFAQFTADDTSNIPPAAKKNTENKNYIQQIYQYQKIAKNAKNNKAKVETSLANINIRQEQIEQELEKIRANKDALNKEFYTKYSRFIQEGTWISEDYIDDNLYYLDAYSVARTSAFPKVTYTINVMSLEGNEEYRGYSFNVGDISYIEDTEFFGYYYSDGIKTPYHEEVIVSERNDHLDSPENNQIHVQNYKTQFEDLFQRIEATSQAVEYSSGAIAKVSNVINEDGSIKVDILQNSISNNSLIIKNAKDQSVTWGDQGITITNLSKPHEVVRLVSGGIMLSTDGGRTYNTGITANGINANYITSGQLDTSVLVIRNGSFPSFRWDKNGISAYKYDGANYNYNQYIRYDQYGLYGTKEEITFNKDASWDDRLAAIREAANFSVTWDGFRIKSDGTDGYVDISSTEDIRVVVGDQTRVKLGQIDSGKYGLKIFNAEGESVLETNDSGNLTLSNIMTIASNSNTVRIGSLEKENVEKIGEDGEKVTVALQKVFDANGEFKVYEDGSFRGTQAYVKGIIVADEGSTFTGKIVAKEGTIGGLNIANISDLMGIRIVSKAGTTFKKSDETVSPANLNFEVSLVGVPSKGSYQWYGGTDLNGLTAINGATASTYSLSTSTIKDNDFYFIRVEYKVTVTTDDTTEEKTYADIVAISRIVDGEKGDKGDPGESADEYIFETSQPEILKFITDANEDTIAVEYSPNVLLIGLKHAGKEFDFASQTATWNVDFEGVGIGTLENLQDEDVIYTDFTHGTDNNATDDTQMHFNKLLLLDVTNTNRLALHLDYLNYNVFNSILQQKINKIKQSPLGFFRIKIVFYTDENHTTALKSLEYIISCKFGTSEEAAKFNINAADFNAAIQNTKLKFSADGLAVYNGGFSIFNKENEAVLSADATGNLVITGKINATAGSFKGHIEADSGFFKGTVMATNITANTGKISGFTLANDSIIADNYTKETIEDFSTIDPNKKYYTLNSKTNEYTRIDFFEEKTFSESENFEENIKYYDYDVAERKYAITGDTSPQLNKTYLYLKDNNNSDEDYYTSNSVLILEGGSSGKIIASNIEIGDNASVDNYIELGNQAYIYNPDKANGLVLQAGNTTITNKGHIDLVSVKGKNGKWSIDASGRAIFDEIHANYAEIGTSILKVNTVQAAGSTMVFKSAYPVTSISEDRNKISIEENTQLTESTLKKDDFVMISCGTTRKYATVVAVSTTTPYIYTLDDVLESSSFIDNETTLLVLGNTAQTTAADYIFAISSDAVTVNNSDSSFFGPHSLTLSQLRMEEIPEIEPDSDSTDETTIESEINLSEAEVTTEVKLRPVFVKHLVLGKLDSVDGLTGYGLYADNVYLKGALTTEISSKTGENISYAGINTMSGATSTQHKKDSSEIVFWAGAADSSITAIQEAPFQVTKNGSLFAKRGQFEGSLLTSSYIKAAQIFTSEVRPISGGAPCLKIYDTYQNEGLTEIGGIWFMNAKGGGSFSNEEKPGEGRPTMALNSQGMYAFWFTEGNTTTRHDFNFINIDADSKTIEVYAQKIAGQVLTTTLARNSTDNIDSWLEISGQSISRVDSSDNSVRIDFGDFTKLAGNSIKDTYISIGDSEYGITLQSKNITVAENIYFGNVDTMSQMRYEHVDNGYNIFIS